MEICCYVMGPLQTNTYLLEEEGCVLLIDPAGKPEKTIDLIRDRKLCAVLLTHGHFDHIKAVDGLYAKYHCPIYIHEADEDMARNKNNGHEFGLVSYVSCPLTHLKEGQMKIGPFEFETVFTPGHTPGSVIFRFPKAIFTGDTLFRGSVGRTDLEGGDWRRLKDSLRYFKELSGEYAIYPGHDGFSWLSEEQANNPYLN